MPTQPTTKRKYPVGIPVQPPPGWRAPPPQRRRGASPFRTQFAWVLRAMLLSLLVIVCMGIGWFLVNGRRPRGEQVAAKAGVQKSDMADRESAGQRTPTDEPKKSGPTPPTEKTKEKPTDPPRQELTYEKDILPIMVRACNNCHGVMKKSGGLDLRTFAAAKKGGDTGTCVVPGKPDDSPLYETIASNRMPPGPKKLPDAERELIRAWIVAGAKP